MTNNRMITTVREHAQAVVDNPAKDNSYLDDAVVGDIVDLAAIARDIVAVTHLTESLLSALSRTRDALVSHCETAGYRVGDRTVLDESAALLTTNNYPVRKFCDGV